MTLADGGASAGGAGGGCCAGTTKAAALSANLAKAVIGAGMVALPRAFLSLGAIAGTALLAAVAALVYATMAVVLRATEDHPGAAGSYAAAAGAVCGRRVALLTRISVVAFCFGFLVVDLLRGSGTGSCDGLICLLTGLDGGPLMGRAVVVAGVALTIAPLLLLRSMSRLSGLNYAGTAAALGVAAIALGLGASAVARGAAHPLPLLASPGGAGALVGSPPDSSRGGDFGTAVLSAHGKKGGQSKGKGGHDHGSSGHLSPGALVDDLAVVLTAYVAHQSLPQALPLLKPYSPRAARAALAAALAVSFTIYAALAVGTGLAFGPFVPGDALVAFSVGAMAPLLGSRAAAVAAAAAVQGGFMLSVLAAFVLFIAPLRAAVAELVWDRRGDTGGSGAAGTAAAQEAHHYLALTYGLHLAATLTAIAVPNVWRALAAIGNSAAALLGFVVPGLMALAMRSARSSGGGAAAGAADAPEPGSAGPLSFPLLLGADLDEEAGGSGGGTPTLAQPAAAQAAAAAAAGEDKAPQGTLAGSWAKVVALAAAAGEVAFIAGCLLLGAALLVNGLVQLLPH